MGSTKQKARLNNEISRAAKHLLFSWGGGGVGVGVGLRWSPEVETVKVAGVRLAVDAWCECDGAKIEEFDEETVESALVAWDGRVACIRRLRATSSAFSIEYRESWTLGLNEGDELEDTCDDGENEESLVVSGDLRSACEFLLSLNPREVGTGKLALRGCSRKISQHDFEIIPADQDVRSILPLLNGASDIRHGGSADFNAQFILSDRAYIAAARYALSENPGGVESYALMPTGFGGYSL